MKRPDVVLIHPPSVFDFRDRTTFHGPVSDVIPSSPVFEMYPVGFLTLAAFLRRQGYRVQIVNLALLMMRSRRFRPERFLARLRPALFGIDLHWLPHAHGGPEVAALLKRLHPDIPIVFGGISATYFHEELIRNPTIDFVLRGSVTEPSLLALLREVEGERRYERVPDLTWKDGGEVRVNPTVILSRVDRAHMTPPVILSAAKDLKLRILRSFGVFAPQDDENGCENQDDGGFDDYGIDLGMMVGSVIRHLDFWTNVPFHGWWRHPITAVFTVRGCARNCATCGASRASFQRFMPGRHPLLRAPESIAAGVRQLAEITRAPIFLVGDLRDGGPAYARGVIDALGRASVSNRIIFEFFDPPAAELLAHIDASIKRWGAELSPESHDENVRTLMGKARFTNEQMEASIEAMLALRCEQLDLFYMIGLPGQTYRNVLEMTGHIAALFQRFDRRLSAFITPMGPFIDPGSDGFERAEAHGYRIRARTLAEHRALLEQRDWESILNYETEWMTRKEIVDATYDAGERLNDLKEQHGRIDAGRAAAVRARLLAARSIRRRLAAGEDVRFEIRQFSQGTINDKAELFPPGAFLRNFRLGGILRLLLRELFASRTESPRGPRATRELSPSR